MPDRHILARMRTTPVNVEPWMRDALRDGFNALQAGNVEEAGEQCRRVLTAKRDLPEGHFLVGLIAMETNDRRTAISAFGSVTKLDPKNAAAFGQLAQLFYTTGQPARAEAALVEAAAIDPDDPLACDLIGSVHAMLGELDDAQAWFRKAVGKDPDSAMYLVNYAHNEMYLGNIDEAESTLRHALDVHPDNPNAHWVLSGLKKATDDRHAQQIRKYIAEGYQAPRAQAFMHYALGKQLEDLQQWDDAFDAFAKGAAARRKTLDFNEAAEIEMFDALRETYDADWLASKGDGHDDRSPIFILGQPRTGTTLIERVVTSHTDVHSAGELRYFGNACRKLTAYRGSERFSASLMRLAADVDVTKLGAMYLQAAARVRGDTPRFVDKLPSNFLFVPLILAALPNARIIHVRRDPMDACFASFKQLFADAYKHSYDLREMARHHARYYHLMQHYREHFGDRYFEIRYEDAASNLEPNARALIDYLGLAWQDDCLNFHAQKSAVTTASTVQVREPAHTRSIGRWRRYETQLQPLADELQKAGVPLD